MLKVSNRLPGMIPTLKRGIKTKTKIPVQLHKDWPGLGSKGEIVRVNPGQMRNQLHPRNGASYVLKGTPLKIPLRTREEILAEKEAIRQKENELEELKQQEEEVRNPKKGYNDVLSALGIRTESKSELNFLKFPSKATANESNNTESASSKLFTLQNSIQSLPPIINLQRESEITGFLKKNLNVKEFVKHIYKLTGSEIPIEDIKFGIKHESGKVQTTEIDHVGSYEVVFKLSNDISIKRTISVNSNGVTPENLSRPLNAKIGENKEEVKDKAGSESEAKKASETESTSKSKSFEWENELLVKLQDKREK